MTENEVYIRCADAMKSAVSLQRQATDLQSATNEYTNVLDELEASWIGPSAQEYLTAARERIDKLKANAKRYEALANAIIKTAKIYERNELSKIRAEKNHC